MKKCFLGLMTVLILLISTMAVNALVLGDKNTKASNLQEDKIVTDTGSFQFTPDVSGSLTCSVQNVDSRYVNQDSRIVNNINVTFGASGSREYVATVSSGTVVTVSVKGRLPENLDAIDRTTRQEKEQKVADIVCKVGTETVHTEILNMQRKNMFQLDKIYGTYDGFEETLSESGDKISDIKPGTTVELEIIGENFYNDDDDIDLSMNTRVHFDDSEVDYDEEDDLDISADDKDSVFFDIDLDEDDVQDKTYTGQVEVYGEDDYGAYHGEEWDIELDVFKEKYELSITSAILNPTVITCDARDVSLSIRVKNTGRNNDDEFKVEISAPTLGISESTDGIDLDETDETRKTYNFVIPEDAEPKVHRFTIKAFVKSISLSDQEFIDLTVPNCGPEPTPEPTQIPQPTPRPNTGGNNDQPNVIIQQPTPIPQQPNEEEDNADAMDEDMADEGSSTTLYVVLLVILIVVLLGGVIGLLIYLLKPAQ